MIFDCDTLKFSDEYFPPYPSVLDLCKETGTCPPKPLIGPEH